MVTRRRILTAALVTPLAGFAAAQNRARQNSQVNRRKEGKTVFPAEQTTLELATLEVQPAPEYVIGYPVHVAVTVKPGYGSQGEKYLSLPYADEFTTGGAFGVSLAGSGSGMFVSKPRPVFDPDLGMSSYVLRPGEARRMLIDLSSLLPVTLRPGDYQAVLAYGPERMRTVSMPFSIRFREPNPEEAAALSALSEELKLARSWGLWSKLQPKQPYLEPAPPRQDPARYNRILRILFFAPDVPPSIPGSLDGIYEAEAGVLRAELAQLAGDAAAFQTYSRQVFSRFPGVRWQIERIMNRESPIIWQRQELTNAN